ncbi:MAG TPA: ABC transporter permease [Aestuariivirgaceae bacterium]|jgi:putative spermidine/putrescine transport system permease protein
MAIYRPGPFALILAILVIAFLIAPLFAVVPTSFTPTSYLSLPSGELSLRHYWTLIEDAQWRESVLLSISIGLASSALATVLATSFALGLWFQKPRFSAALIGFVMMPMIVPPVVSAITLYFLLTSISRISAALGYDTWAGVVLAHTVMIAPFAVILILVALSQLDRRIDMAARGMGASLWQRISLIIVPNLRFGIMTAFFLCFVLSWEEIGVTLFITSTNAITLPRLVWMGLRDNVDPAVAAVSVLLIALTVLVLAIVILGRERWSRSRALGQG